MRSPATGQILRVCVSDTGPGHDEVAAPQHPCQDLTSQGVASSLALDK